MILKDLLNKIGVKIDSISICTPFLEVNLSQNENNKIASWKLYVELVTRITTQSLDEEGYEKAALDSIYNLFDVTRVIIKEYGREAESFSMLSICMLNLCLRPFTTKWHRVFTNEIISKNDLILFRKDLQLLQGKLLMFTDILSQMASVSDYSQLSFDCLDKYENLNFK